MPRPPVARERILDAFENLLIEQGEPGATLDAVAARAEVSKGGLLYHFGSKEALIEGLMARLDESVAADLTAMREAEEGPVDYLIRTAVESNSGLLHTILASATLAQGSHESVQAHLRAMQNASLSVLRDAVPDPTISRVIALISDGLYYNSALRLSDDPDRAQLDAIVHIAERLAAGEA